MGANDEDNPYNINGSKNPNLISGVTASTAASNAGISSLGDSGNEDDDKVNIMHSININQ